MTTFDHLHPLLGERLQREFERQFDITPNPKGATPIREALDERANTQEAP